MAGFPAPRKNQKKREKEKKRKSKKSKANKKKREETRLRICTKQLISLVHEAKALWRVGEPGHGKRNVTTPLWIDVTKRLGLDENDPIIRGKVRGRWGTLSSRFKRELDKFPKLKSGSEAKNYKSSWPLFKSLLFLKENFKPAESSSNIDLALGKGKKSEETSSSESSCGSDSEKTEHSGEESGEEDESETEEENSEEDLVSSSDGEKLEEKEEDMSKDKKYKKGKEKEVDKSAMKTSNKIKEKIAPTIESIISSGGLKTPKKTPQNCASETSLPNTTSPTQGTSVSEDPGILTAPLPTSSAPQNLFTRPQSTSLMSTQPTATGARGSVQSFENGTDDSFFGTMMVVQKNLPLVEKLELWQSIAGDVKNAVAKNKKAPKRKKNDSSDDDLAKENTGKAQRRKVDHVKPVVLGATDRADMQPMKSSCDSDSDFDRWLEERKAKKRELRAARLRSRKGVDHLTNKNKVPNRKLDDRAMERDAKRRKVNNLKPSMPRGTREAEPSSDDSSSENSEKCQRPLKKPNESTGMNHPIKELGTKKYTQRFSNLKRPRTKNHDDSNNLSPITTNKTSSAKPPVVPDFEFSTSSERETNEMSQQTTGGASATPQLDLSASGYNERKKQAPNPHRPKKINTAPNNNDGIDIIEIDHIQNEQSDKEIEIIMIDSDSDDQIFLPQMECSEKIKTEVKEEQDLDQSDKQEQMSMDEYFQQCRQKYQSLFPVPVSPNQFQAASNHMPMPFYPPMMPFYFWPTPPCRTSKSRFQRKSSQIMEGKDGIQQPAAAPPKPPKTSATQTTETPQQPKEAQASGSQSAQASGTQSKKMEPTVAETFEPPKPEKIALVSPPAEEVEKEVEVDDKPLDANSDDEQNTDNKTDQEDKSGNQPSVSQNEQTKICGWCQQDGNPCVIKLKDILMHPCFQVYDEYYNIEGELVYPMKGLRTLYNSPKYIKENCCYADGLPYPDDDGMN